MHMLNYVAAPYACLHAQKDVRQTPLTSQRLPWTTLPPPRKISTLFLLLDETINGNTYPNEAKKEE